VKATTLERTELRRLERAAVHAWPAAETEEIDGWLLRATGGGSRRANSVSTLRYGGTDLAASIARVEARYADRRAAAQFCVTDVSEPPDLEPLLRARGYRVEEECTTLARSVVRGRAQHDDIVAELAASEAWLDVYLGAVTPSRRGVAASILARVPAPRVFLAYVRESSPVSVGLAVRWEDVVVVQCMATRADARRRGGASAILAAIESWASSRGAARLCLAAVADNAPAQALYRRNGFTLAGTYRTLVR
jgi:GNAT superfamily N-acetyltransferase